MLKESNNPLNKGTPFENTKLSKSKEESVDSDKELKEKTPIIGISLEKNKNEDIIKKLSFPERNNSDTFMKVNTQGNLNCNIYQKDTLINKNERYKLEQKLKNDLKNTYKEMEIEINSIKNIKNKDKINNNKYISSRKLFNQINKNKKSLLKKLIIIQIPLLILVCFNIIVYKILNNIVNQNELNLYISSLTLSSILSFFKLFLIILLIF